MREGKGQATLTLNPRFSVRWPLPNGTRVISLYDTAQYRLPVATGTREENNNNKIQETARVSNATATQGTLCNSDWVGHHRLQWYGANSILVSKYSGYRSPSTTSREACSRQILKRAPKSYSSGCQGAIEAGSTERILEVKLFGREEYLG